MSKEVPALPSATNVDAATPRLTLGEDAKITFDHLGPIVGASETSVRCWTRTDEERFRRAQ